MSMEKPKAPGGKDGKNQPTSKTPSSPTPVRGAPLPPPALPPLFRKIDWLTFTLTLVLVFIGYLLTISPDLTLEDSGELAVASMYAGIPHPPGYPVWTIYTWLFTKIIPFSNMAFRVSVGCAFSGALACGLIGLAVSRGSSMMIEGIASLKSIDRRLENAICVVSGFVAGTLIGFNGYMWSQAVIVEVYPFSLVSLMGVILCLMRWIYAPHQRRYIYWAWFLFGICFTNHQSLLVAAMGIEIAIIAGQPKLGRDFLIGNSICYILGLFLKANGLITSWNSAPGQLNMIFVIFNMVGLASLVGAIWLTIKTKKVLTEWLPVIVCGVVFLIGAAFYLYMPLAGMSNPPLQWGYPRTPDGFIHALTRGQYEKTNPTNFLTDPMRFVGQLGMLFSGVVDEFNWVYALIALVPFVFFIKMQRRERAWLIGVAAIYFCLGILLIALFNPPPDRQARELIRVFFTASHVMIALCVGYGLTLIAAFMATQYERFRQIGIFGGSIAAAFSIWSLARTVEDTFQEDSFFRAVGRCFAKDQYSLPVIAGLLLIAATLIFVLAIVLSKTKPRLGIVLAVFLVGPTHSFMSHWADNEQLHHYFGYWFGHDMFTPPFVAPDGKLSYDPKLREQMLKDPEKAKFIYPEMDRDTVLFGGTDPGRFCPTYMIFCESFTPADCKKNTDPNFDRRDVYIITQNALADGTYLQYIRAHYNRSTEIDTPFFQPWFRSGKEKKLNYRTNLVARIVGTLLDKPSQSLGDHIEKMRRVGSSFFEEKDFLDLPSLAGKLRKSDSQDAVSKFIHDNLSRETQELLGKSADSRLASALAKDLNRIIEREVPPRRAKQEDKVQELSFYNAERFKGVQLTEKLQRFIAQEPQSHTRVRLNRLLLEHVYPKELATSPGGVYPDLEIFTPTPEESQQCFNEYLQDAQKRLAHDMQFPNEPKQIRPGEDVKILNVGGEQRVQVTGQVAVMAINGLLTKVIFDKNPGHEFYVEESFPLDWMYPHLTPYGIIMKINREPLPELTEDIVKRDHEFWSRYAERLIGTNVVNYDTPVSNIAAFIEKVYLEHNFSGFQGDRKFVRDDQAQKAFSKLRSSIGGVYAWRVGEVTQQIIAAQQKPPGQRSQEEINRLNHLMVVRERMIKETDFTFRQAFAFCPYSPEAVFRYSQFLLQMNPPRLDDAWIVATTCQKLDPHNGSVIGLVENLRTYRKQAGLPAQPASQHDTIEQQLKQVEQEYRSQPTNFQAAVNLASVYMRMGKTDQVHRIFEQALANPKINEQAVIFIATAYRDMGDFPRLERALERLVEVTPGSPEAWFDLAALKASVSEINKQDKTADALKALRRSMELNDQRRANSAPASSNLVFLIKSDPRFNLLRTNAEFQKLTGGK